MERRKIKNGEKSPWGSCLTRLMSYLMSYQTNSKRSPPFWLLIGARKILCFSAQSEARMAATVWNWSGKTLPQGSSRRSLLFFVPYFSTRLDFPSPPLSAPGSPRMRGTLREYSSKPLKHSQLNVFQYLNGIIGIFLSPKNFSCVRISQLKVQ